MGGTSRITFNIEKIRRHGILRIQHVVDMDYVPQAGFHAVIAGHLLRPRGLWPMWHGHYRTQHGCHTVLSKPRRFKQGCEFVHWGKRCQHSCRSRSLRRNTCKLRRWRLGCITDGRDIYIKKWFNLQIKKIFFSHFLFTTFDKMVTMYILRPDDQGSQTNFPICDTNTSASALSPRS